MRVSLKAVFLVASLGGCIGIGAAGVPARIGVLIKRSPERCREKWEATAAYLGDQVPNHDFVIVPLLFDEVRPAVAARQVDFLLVNSAMYVEVEVLYGVTRLATLRNRVGADVVSEFGGVVFSRAGPEGVMTPADLRGRGFVAVAPMSFGGWLVARRALHEVDADPVKVCADVRFLGSHDAVVQAVLSGEADVGTVRSDALERLVNEGMLKMADVQVLVLPEAASTTRHFPFALSTRLYPEWPFAQLQHTDRRLAEKVAIALINMPEEHPAAVASRSAGWTVPANYLPVAQCLQTLRVSPYERHGRVTLRGLWRDHGGAMVLLAATVMAIIVLAARGVVLTRRLRGAVAAQVAEVRSRRAAEGQAARERDYLEHAISAVTQPFLIIDARTMQVTMANDAARGGMALGESVCCHALTHGTDTPCGTLGLSCPVEEVRKTGEPVVLEHEHELPDGRTVIHEIHGFPMLGPDGEVTEVIEYCLDVTERRRAENKVREGAKFLQTVLDLSATAVFTVDTGKRFTSVNRAFCEITGLAPEDVIGQPCSVLDGTPCADRCGLFDRDRSGADIYGVQCTLCAKDGRRLTVLKNAGLVRDTEGMVTGGVECFVDVTALHDAQAAAEAASTAKGEFLANMSHEIRTPMNGILGMTDILLGTELTPEQVDCAQTIARSGDALLALINDILDFSKIEAGRLQLTAEPFNLRETVEEVAQLLAVKASEKGLDLIVRYDPTAPQSLVGDPARIRQMVLNLAGNAVKFTDTGHVLIEVLNVTTDRERAVLELRVGDTGVGIAEDHLQVIFDKFEQVDSSNTRRFEGTGLGLAITRQLTEMMGGLIEVESELGKGTLFRLTLTLPRAEKLTEVFAAAVDLHGIRVLAVDDNAVNRQVIVEILRSWGMRATAVASGALAMVALREAVRARDPYRLAVLDCQMPEMDGPMLARQIKQDPQLRDAILLLFSSVGVPMDAAAVREMGFAACVAKPIRRSKLFNTIADAWIGQVAPASPETPRTSSLPTFQRQFAGRVLLVEDNVSNQKVAGITLRKFGCEVDVVGNGREAVERLREHDYDLVFMDCQMPVMDGFEATARIRADQGSARHTPIIAMTARAMESDREECLRAGMDDYIAKPVRHQPLLRVLQHYLRGVAPPVPAPPVPAPTPVPTPAASGDVVDPTQLNDLAEGDIAMIRDIVAEFSRSVGDYLAALEAAAAAGDSVAVGNVLHALKGAAANVGAVAVAGLARELESAVRGGQGADVTGSLSRLHAGAAAADARFRELGWLG